MRPASGAAAGSLALRRTTKKQFSTPRDTLQLSCFSRDGRDDTPIFRHLARPEFNANEDMANTVPTASNGKFAFEGLPYQLPRPTCPLPCHLSNQVHWLRRRVAGITLRLARQLLIPDTAPKPAPRH